MIPRPFFPVLFLLAGAAAPAAAPVTVLVDPSSFVLIRPTATQLANANNLGGGGGGSYTFTTPLLNTSGTITIGNAAADGSTKGAAAFAAADFDAASGLISLDYTNGQAASGSTKGFLTSADWTTFNAKAPLASPTFTGVPAAPTAAADTNTTQVATTAFVIGQSYLKTATAASTYQPLDSDLTSLAALTTTAFGRSFIELADAAAGRTLLGLGTLATQSGTFSGTSSGTNTGDQTITLSGDVSGSGTAGITATLATVNSNVGTFGNSSNAVQITVNAKGLVTAISNATISGGGGLSSTDIDTSAELRAIVTDETGTGALVFASDPVLLAPNAAMGALAIDVTKLRNTKTATGDHTFTFSGTPAAGASFGLVLTGHSAATTQTIPASLSLARGGASITSFTLPANAKVELSWVYDGTNYFLAGEPFTIADLSTVSPASADLVAFRDVSGGVDGQNTLANVVLAGLPAFSGDATSSAGASALTLATVNGNVGTFGNATQTASVTVNAKGLVTAISNVTVTPAVGSITGLGTGVATALAAAADASGGFTRKAYVDTVGTDLTSYIDSVTVGKVAGTASSVDSELMLFSGTGGKTAKRATGTGLAKLTSGVLSTATAGTDYLTKATRTVQFPLTIDALADGMSYTIGRVPAAFTITGIYAVHEGSGLSSPSILLKVFKGTDRTSGTEVVTAGNTVTSSTTGSSITSFDSASVSANSWLWVTTASKSGTTANFSIVVTGTYD